MKIIATKNNSILSKLIRWGLNEEASHIAFVFDNDTWLFQSNLLGVIPRLYPNFIKRTKTIIIDSIEYKMPLEDEEIIFQGLVKNLSESEYDYGGFLYFSWRVILYKFLKIKIPAINKWGKSNMYLCNELIEHLPTSLTGLPKGFKLDMTTPMQSMRILRRAKNAGSVY